MCVRDLTFALLLCSLTLKLEKAQRMLAAVCSRARNAYSRKQLKADFTEGLEELHEQAGSKDASGETREERNKFLAVRHHHEQKLVSVADIALEGQSDALDSGCMHMHPNVQIGLLSLHLDNLQLPAS